MSSQDAAGVRPLHITADQRSPLVPLLPLPLLLPFALVLLAFLLLLAPFLFAVAFVLAPLLPVLAIPVVTRAACCHEQGSR